MKALFTLVFLSLFMVSCSDGNGPLSDESNTIAATPPDDDAPQADELEVSDDSPPAAQQSPSGQESPPVEEQTPIEQEATAEEETPVVEEATVDDEHYIERASSIDNYAHSRARPVLLKINQRLFSGTLEDAERNCIESDQNSGRPILELACEPGYPVVGGLLTYTVAETDTVAYLDPLGCEADLINGRMDRCYLAFIQLFYEPLGLSYAYNGDDPVFGGFSVTRDSDSLFCSISTESVIIEADDFDECKKLVTAFIESIEQRASPSAMAAMSNTGQRLTERARRASR